MHSGERQNWTQDGSGMWERVLRSIVEYGIAQCCAASWKLCKHGIGPQHSAGLKITLAMGNDGSLR